MALTFEVQGPTKVSIDIAGGTSYGTGLGYTDNSDLISFELDYMTEPILTTRMGNIPENYVHLGTIGYLNMTLVKFDQALIEDLIHAVPDGAAEGDVGTVGKLRMNTNDTGDGDDFALKLDCATTSDVYSFHKCIIEGRGIRMLDFGNRPQRMGLSIICLPNQGSDDTLAGTDNIYGVSRG